MYESEITQFIRTLKAQKPHLENQQKEARALLWDKTIDRTMQASFEAAAVPQQAYVYQTKN